jgi:hypothetical protein
MEKAGMQIIWDRICKPRASKRAKKAGVNVRISEGHLSWLAMWCVPSLASSCPGSLIFKIRSTDLEAPVAPPPHQTCAKKAKDVDEDEAKESGVSSKDNDQEMHLSSNSDLSGDADELMGKPGPDKQETQPHAFTSAPIIAPCECSSIT